MRWKKDEYKYEWFKEFEKFDNRELALIIIF